MAPSPVTGALIYKRLLRYVLPYKHIFLISLLGMAVVAAAEVAFAALLKPIMDGGFVERDRAIIQMTPFLLMGVFIARAIGSVADEYCIAWVGRKVIFDLRGQLFAKTLRLPARYFDQNPTSTLISRMIYDLEQVAEACTIAVRVSVKDSLLAIGLVVWMFILSWQLTLLFLLITPLVALVVRKASKRFRRSSAKIQGSMAGITHIAKEALQGHRVVKAYAGFGDEEAAFETANQANRRQSLRRVAVAAISVPLLLLIAGAGVSFIIYLALSDTVGAFVTPGTFVSYMGTILLLMSPIKRLARVNEYIQAGIAAAETVFDLFDQQAEATEEHHTATIATGEIKLENVHFSYRDADPPALDGVSLTINPGETVALVGESGSGKSTVASLLLGFYRAQEGRILIDGRALGDYSLSELRAKVAWVSQEPILFDGTIKKNIAYGQPEASDAEVEALCQEVGIDKFLGDGTERVGEFGGRLSGGQRQRVALARALLKKSPILVLDEATSALDMLAEQAIKGAIMSRAAGRSVLLIAHRLSFISHANTIHVFSDGRIVESGTHQSLMALGGRYTAMWAAQEAEGAPVVGVDFGADA